MENLPALFKIKIRGLALGTHPVELTVPADKLDIPMFYGDVRAKGEIKVSGRIELHLKLEAIGTFNCDRCACEFERTFTPDLDLVYLPPELSKDVEEDDNIHFFDPQTTNEIVFTEDIRDALFLSIPMKNLHSPDCKGLDIGGEDIEIDERLVSLGGLLEKLREEEMNSGAPPGVSQG